MPVVVGCSCGKQLRVPDQFVGRKIKCPACGDGIQVKAAPPPVEEVVDDGLLRFECTHCGAAMQAKAEFAGKQTRCPTCQKVVKIGGAAATAPVAVTTAPKTRPAAEARVQQKMSAAARAAAVDDDDDYDDEDDDDDRPRRRQGGSKFKKAKGMPLWPFLVGGGLLLFLLTGGGVVYFVFFANSGAGVKDIDLIPADATMVMSLRPSELLKKPAFQQFVQTNPMLGQMLAKKNPKEIGFDEIERMIWVWQPDGKFYFTIQATRGTTEADLAEDMKQKLGSVPTVKKAGGKNYYVPSQAGMAPAFGGQPPGQPPAMQMAGMAAMQMAQCLYNDRLVIVGYESEVVKVLERGTKVNKQGPLEDVLKKMAGPDLLVAGGIPGPGVMKQMADQLKAQYELSVDALADVSRIQLIGNMDQNIVLELNGLLPDGAKAEQVRKGLDAGKTTLIAAIAVGRLFLTPKQSKLARETINTLSITSSDKAVTIKVSMDTNHVFDLLK